MINKTTKHEELTSAMKADTFEGFGIVYLEANAAGVPVLAARQGGAVDAVKEGVSGFFVDEPSVAGVRNALRRFLRGDLCFEENAVRKHARNFLWTHIVDRIEKEYWSRMKTKSYEI